MPYVPPHRRFSVATGATVATAFKTPQQIKKDVREMFPILRDTKGETVFPVPHVAAISWAGITFHEDDVIVPAEHKPLLKDGWVDLRVYVPDTSTTSKQLEMCAENMLSNYRRFYVERGLEIPQWVDDNPYEDYADFDRTIPYETEYVSDSESSSEGEDPIYESDTSN